MTIPNRTVSITGVFAQSAITTIPQTPVPGTSYRDTSLTATQVKAGWPFKTIVDSGKFNQALFQYSTICSQIEKYGFLPWSSLTNYVAGSLCLGSDGVIYQAKQNTGPSSTAKDPTTDTANTYWEDFVGKTYVTKAGSNTISANNTFSGSNTFSGAVALGSSATATTPARTDNDTSVATTAWGYSVLNGTRTNCLTAIPQDIVLELNNGTLTLKAGSVLYQPNGSGVFDVVTNSSDLTCTQTTDGEFFVCETYNGNGITTRLISACTSGAGATTVSGFAYDTTTNKINNYSAGGVAGVQYTFPIAIVTVSGGSITSIDQVFNGFGYIGSTVFALPGVMGLRANGRNTDGTLKSIAWDTSNVVTRTFTDTNDTDLAFNGSSLGQNSHYYLDEDGYLHNSTGTITNSTKIGRLARTSGKIDSMTIRPVFNAVDRSETATLSENNTFRGNNTFEGSVSLGSSATATTPASSDNDTSVATTEFCQTMFANAVGTPKDVTILWGDGTGINTPSELPLSEDFTNFEQLGYVYSNDNGTGKSISFISTFWLNWLLTNTGSNYTTSLTSTSGSLYMWVYPYNYTTAALRSTKTKFIVNGENCLSYYIFGINRKVKNVPEPVF